MKKLRANVISFIVLFAFIFISCNKTSEELQNWGPPAPQPPANTNYFPPDSLSGKEFLFSDVPWITVNGGVIAQVHRPDLFYSYDRSIRVTISMNGTNWIEVLACPYPTDLFFLDYFTLGFLKIYPYNYNGILLGTKVQIAVKFLN